jgi:NAD+ kinase
VEHVNSCNAIISVGGDGTFLKVASMIRRSEVVLAGINSDPHNSAGSLCTLQNEVPAIHSFLENLLHGTREPLVRSRLQCTVREFGVPDAVVDDGKLPYALNEVFVASNDPSAVSSFALSIDGEPEFHSKNSGILISTGTGSAGWLETDFTVTLIHVAIWVAFFLT